MDALPLRYWVAILAMNTLALLTALGVALYTWLSAEVIAVGLLGAFVLPLGMAAGMAAIIIDPTKTAQAFVSTAEVTVRSTFKRIVLASAPVLIIGGLAALVTHALWSSPTFRAFAVSEGVEVGFPAVAERGLFDIDPGVAMISCESLGESGNSDSAAFMAQALVDTQDGALIECLLKSIPGTPEPRVAQVLEYRVTQWREALIQGQAGSPDAACRMATWIRESERLGHASAPADLAICMVASSDEPSQFCCAQALKASSRGVAVAQSLPSASALARYPWASSRAKSLVAATTPGTLSTQAEEISNWPAAQNRRWATEFACESMRKVDAPTRYAIGESLRAVLGRTCTMPLPEVTETTYRHWDRACSLAFENADAGGESALCRNLLDASVTDAVASSQLKVIRAYRRAAYPARAGEIDRALLKYDRAHRPDADVDQLRRSRGKRASGNPTDGMFEVFNSPRGRAMEVLIKEMMSDVQP